MSNVLSTQKKNTVEALGRLGWSLRQIEAATGVRRETASGYLKAAGVPVALPGRGRKPAMNPPPDPGPLSRPEPLTGPTSEGPSASNPATNPSPDSGGGGAVTSSNPATNPSPDLEPPKARKQPGPASECEPYREQIEAAVELGRNAKGIWQDLVDENGFSAGYSSVKRYVLRLRGRRRPQAHPVITTAAGEEAQVDYGTGPMVRDPVTGKYRRTRLFVLTLGYSRKAIRLLSFQSSSEIWSKLHEEAFKRLGGATRVVVLDNLREGVLKPDVYDPELNPLYRDVLAHYGASALPCRVRHPDRKGKVEAGVGHAKKTPLKGKRFESLEEAQAYLDHWEERWADTRIHGTTKQQVSARFEAERAALLPLPLEPFRYYRYGARTVHLDGCVEIDGAYYGAPSGRVGDVLSVQWDGVTVRLLEPHTGQLLVEHDHQVRGSYRVREEDRPASTPPELGQLLARARVAGKAIGALCQRIFSSEEEFGARRILGVLALAKKHGPAAVEDACDAALELGVPTYRMVRRYLEKRPSPALTLRQVDPLIRELTHYKELIELRTGGTSE